MKKLNILFIPERLRWKISIRCWAVAILPSAELCMSAPIVAILNLSLSVVTAAFVPLVVTNMPWNALPICLLNWSMLLIATVFYHWWKSPWFFLYDRSLLNCLFMQLTASFPVCFSNLINPKTSLPALSWFYIPLAETSNGILISIAFFQKVGLVMMASGVMSVTLIILTFAMRSALHSWMKCILKLDLLLKNQVQMLQRP